MNQPLPKKHTTRNALAYLAIIVATGMLLFFTQHTWLPMVQKQFGGSSAAVSRDDHTHDHEDDSHSGHDHSGHDHSGHDHSGHDHSGHSHSGHSHAGHSHSSADEQLAADSTVELSEQAKRNLKLSSKRAFPQNFWKRIVIPGEIIDRPGLSDRSLTSPISGVITHVHVQQGDIVKPGDRIATVRLVSGYLQQAQSDLFKAVRETEIASKEIDRIQAMVDRGIVPEKRVIMLQQEIERQRSQIDATYQDLITRGFSDQQVADAKQGKFLTSLDIRAPVEIEIAESRTNDTSDNLGSGSTLKLNSTEQANSENQFFEIQKLVCELGHQIQPGEQIAVLSDHQHLYVRGHAFKREAANLERVMEKGWSVDVEFVEDVPENWPKLNQRYKVRNLSNEVDPDSRTFDFFIPMENQSRIYEGDDRTSVVWRFRPGQRVRLQVPVSKIENALVLPAASVVRDGAEIYAFQEVGKYYRRFPVHVIYQDRKNVVLANDGSLPIGAAVAQGSAASLNRVLKSQTNEGGKEFHVHADGTVHSNSDH